MASILTFCYSVFINIDGKLNQIAKNKISSFESTNTWEDVLSDFMNKANVTLQKTDSVTISVCKNSTDVESFHPDISESISVLNTFDCSLKYVTYNIKRESDIDDQNNNVDGDEASHSNAFTMMMQGENSKKPKTKTDGNRVTGNSQCWSGSTEYPGYCRLLRMREATLCLLSEKAII
ncbi:uncharacterized protein LOC128217737 isoform X2 [Mya arenaria]|uniref:uncharacterized protein LOC128217737 isoform X2 n=1 Tax=Mya arenaria TaxID=6604 RepID=UPI0022E3B423|nr:uncharacterized protein LOC128217737 isoform X2 [Mya arenaria]